MIAETSLDIRGYHDLAVANTFMRQQAETDHLSIFLPGYAYTNAMPVLYYTWQLLVSRGADALLIDTEYARVNAYNVLPERERMRWVYADASAAAQAALAQRAYRRVTLVGKSLGTLAAGYLVDREPRLPSVACIWLTPILTADVLRAQIAHSRPASLFVIGTGDHFYNPDALAELESVTGGRSLVIPGADHALELPGDALASVDALRQVVSAVDDFLPKGTPTA